LVYEFSGKGLRCSGVKNILEFVKSGGSFIAMGFSGTSLFAKSFQWQNPKLKSSQGHHWNAPSSGSGWFRKLCRAYAFKGVIIGPQESNKPYPTAKFLPIKMNLENELVREANLPSIIYQIVVGGGSIIPDKGQPLDIVGWYPNGTIATAIVPYAYGKIILSNPHPNISGRDAMFWRNFIMNAYAKRWGWSFKMFLKGREVNKTNKDLDGPKPDQEFSKAMLLWAYKKASH
jgi:hypothetical protein